jgi:hypothetical protein
MQCQIGGHTLQHLLGVVNEGLVLLLGFVERFCYVGVLEVVIGRLEKAGGPLAHRRGNVVDGFVEFANSVFKVQRDAFDLLTILGRLFFERLVGFAEEQVLIDGGGGL